MTADFYPFDMTFLGRAAHRRRTQRRQPRLRHDKQTAEHELEYGDNSGFWRPQAYFTPSAKNVISKF